MAQRKALTFFNKAGIVLTTEEKAAIEVTDFGLGYLTHDIGKNIFKMLGDSAGFEVHDLGVDVDPTSFTEAIKKFNPQVLGLSGLCDPRGLGEEDLTDE